ncbi:MAG: aldehyde dehydrogenase family protein [Deltaproteobacteria bacterium]|nr:aldehyde dehydrogenase family protein [Deltaproteobacteria bacterium]
MNTVQPGKVTYISLSADDPTMNAAFDRGIAEVRGQLGKTWPLHINGRPQSTAATFDSFSPGDTRVLVARVASATATDVANAVAVARGAFATWTQTPWQERAKILGKAAGLIRARRFELAAWMIFEMGKNRVEALGEIEETADLIDYYNQQMRANDGYVRAMDRLAPTDNNTSVMRPYGVWAVIAPWNFPYALLAAPAAAALLTGNTVVMKPSSETPLSAVLMAQIFADAGLPPGTVNCLTGSGRVVGDGLARHPDVDGVTFTGSLDVGFKQIFRQFSTNFPKPCIVEMGGKNPAIVMDSADLDQAAAGVYRSAFGMNGHKCSACSRLYVHEAVADDLLARLGRKVADTRIGDPLLKETFVGPVATRAGYEDFQRFVGLAGDTVRIGGRALADGAFAHGYFVQPTVLVGLPRDHQLMRDELFVPILAVQTVKNLDEALREANDTPFGLTAGMFSGKQTEIDTFLERIEAGVVYVNRAAGATTGAWPGVQPFGGWKGSGSTGKNIGGLYTLPCYMREQSRTVCE